MTVRRRWGCAGNLALCGGFRGAFWGHARFAGMGCVEHWIPACAGMTAELESGPRRLTGIIDGQTTDE